MLRIEEVNEGGRAEGGRSEVHQAEQQALAQAHSGDRTGAGQAQAQA